LRAEGLTCQPSTAPLMCDTCPSCRRFSLHVVPIRHLGILVWQSCSFLAAALRGTPRHQVGECRLSRVGASTHQRLSICGDTCGGSERRGPPERSCTAACQGAHHPHGVTSSAACTRPPAEGSHQLADLQERGTTWAPSRACPFCTTCRWAGRKVSRAPPTDGAAASLTDQNPISWRRAM
jgi:hypothetical protein